MEKLISFLEEERDLIVFAIDVSGSMKFPVFSSVYDEIRAANSKRTITLEFECIVKNIREWETRELPKNLPPFLAGGGTFYDVIFTEIEDKNLYPNCVVIYTDGIGWYPVREEPNFNVFWVIDEPNENLSFNPGFGEKIFIK